MELFCLRPAGIGLRPGEPRACPEGTSEAYWRTLSTDMKRVGMRRDLVPGPPAVVRRGARAGCGRSRESVTLQIVSTALLEYLKACASSINAIDPRTGTA